MEDERASYRNRAGGKEINMETVREIIRKKPVIYVRVTASYILAIVLFKWLLHPSFDALWFVLGGVLGLYFLDGAEEFFALSPSPFHSVFFEALFAVVSLFVVTSSTGTIGSGLVLSVYLQMILRQWGEWKISGTIASWFRMMAMSVDVRTQKYVIVGNALAFVLLTVIFVR